ncbi:hypothetical protein B0H13DRAFT_2368541 [Mycena leptocephala]|nr:hypothetical protein B0H13DRAFT_2368541 [Mycena leptocephala]
MSTMDIDNMKIARDVQLSRSLFLAGIVILLYDHLLTIGSEIQHIWVTTHKRSSMWFLLIRYFSFAGNIVMALDTFGDFGPEEFIIGCTSYSCYIMPALMTVEGTLFLRVYYVSGRVVHRAGGPQSHWQDKRSRLLCPAIENSVGKLYVYSFNPFTDWTFTAETFEWRPHGLESDILVIGLTLCQLSYATVLFISGESNPVPLGGVPDNVRSIICLVNMTNILMFYFGDIYTSNSLSWFKTAISVAMISRLMLNLHVAAAREIGMDTDMELETVRFVRRSGTDITSGGE